MLVELAVWAVLGGAPMARTDARAVTPVPLGAPVRVEVDANCTSSFSRAAFKAWKLLQAGKPRDGEWRFEEPALAPAEPGRYRVRFFPREPLAAGGYELTGLPNGSQPLTVGATADTTAPQGQLTGATCVDRRPPMEGCDEDHGALTLEHTEATDASATRWVIRMRPRGKPPKPEHRWETERIPVGWRLLDPSVATGAWVVTLRLLDAADNEGGTPCEVELELPLHTCKKFGPHADAKCAQPGKGPGEWVSAIDGVAFHLPP